MQKLHFIKHSLHYSCFLFIVLFAVVCKSYFVLFSLLCERISMTTCHHLAAAIGIFSLCKCNQKWFLQVFAGTYQHPVKNNTRKAMSLLVWKTGKLNGNRNLK